MSLGTRTQALSWNAPKAPDSMITSTTQNEQRFSDSQAPGDSICPRNAGRLLTQTSPPMSLAHLCPHAASRQGAAHRPLFKDSSFPS